MSISIDDRIFDIADDIRGLRLPMPPPLEWVNAYFLRDGHGWIMVDTGYNTPDSRAVLEAMIADHLDEQPITGVVATHYHPDHSGQAGWICDKFGCPLYMSHTEWLLARWLSTDHTNSYREMIADYYRRAGTPEDIYKTIIERGNTFLRTCDEIPATYHRLSDGQNFKIGHRNWKVIIGRGHAPEMILLYDEIGKILISADQVVARITPNISIWAFDTEANPLKDFIHSSDTLPTIIPNDVQVLPGHGRPFENFHEKIGTYNVFHERRLQKLLDGMTGEPQTLYELLKILFPKDLSPRDYVFALGETHSHVNYLVHEGRAAHMRGSSMLFKKL